MASFCQANISRAPSAALGLSRPPPSAKNRSSSPPAAVSASQCRHSWTRTSTDCPNAFVTGGFPLTITSAPQRAHDGS
jgi:hypothetical protein